MKAQDSNMRAQVKNIVNELTDQNSRNHTSPVHGCDVKRRFGLNFLLKGGNLSSLLTCHIVSSWQDNARLGALLDATT